MKVAVLGTTGMLGNYVYLWLKKQGHDVHALNRDRMDMSSSISVYSYVQNYEWDYVVNCVGITKQKSNTVSEKEMVQINTMLPHWLQDACERKSTKLIHISTDCVFSGKPNRLRIESALSDAPDLYGRSKALGEPSKATVIRTSIVGSEVKGKKSLLEWVKTQDGKQCNGYVNHHWNGVTCLQLAQFIDYLITNKISWEGVRHYTSPHIISKYGLVRCIAHAYKLNVEVKMSEAAELKDMCLTSRFPGIFIPRSIPEQLEEMYEFDRKNNLL